MSIDWVTVGAQVVNFLVLVLLLKKFLYQPVLQGLAAREAAIAERLATAASTQQAAAEAEAQWRQLEAEQQAKVTQLLEAAQEQAQAEKAKLLQQTQEYLARQQAQAQAALDVTQAEFIQELQRKAATDLLSVSQKIIQDLADTKLEAAIARQLVARLQQLQPDLAAELGQSKQQGELRSSLALPAATQDSLLAELGQLLPDVELTFVVAPTAKPNLGVSLHLGSTEVVWTLDSYVEDLNKSFASLHLAHPAAKNLAQ